MSEHVPSYLLFFVHLLIVRTQRCLT